MLSGTATARSTICLGRLWPTALHSIRALGRDLSFVASSLALLSILAYGLVLFQLPAGSFPLIVVDNLGSVLAAGLSAMLCTLAARRQSAWRASLSWLLLGLGLACWAFGDGYWSWLEIVVGESPSVPSWSDVGYVAMVVFVIAGTALHPIVRHRDVSRAHVLIDVAIVLGAVIAVAWTVVLDPLFDSLATAPIAQAVTLLYPLGSLGALALLTVLMLRSAEAPISSRLLALGWACIATADAAYVVLNAEDTYATGNPADLFWFAGAVLIGLAATLDRPRPTLARPAHEAGSTWQFAAPAILLLLAGAVVWVHGLGSDLHLPSPEQLALAVAVVLLVVRVILAYRDTIVMHELHVQQEREREAARVAREESARLQGVILTGRELGHLLSNDLAMAVGWIDLLREHPRLPAELRKSVRDAAFGLDRAVEHLHRLQQVNRVATHETPVGPALDLEQSAAS
ncbi:MAG: hypothetical protein U0893_12605 [Chloroflexota bacterium]